MVKTVIVYKSTIVALLTGSHPYITSSPSLNFIKAEINSAATF